MSSPSTPRDYRLTFCILALGVSSYALLQSMSVPTMPTIQAELHASQSATAWVLTAFLLSASVATPIVGRLGDSYGKKKMFVISILMLAVGSLVAALAPNISVMILARVVQGVGGGCLPLAFGIIRDELPHKHVPTAIGLTSSLLAVGFGVGIVVAGPIMDGLGYHWIFLLPMLVAILAALGALFLVPESPVRSGEHIPVLPGVLLGGWLVALLVGASRAPHWGWGSWQVVGLMALAVVLFCAWVYTESHVRIPLVDLRMMRLRGVWTANLVALLIGVAMYGSFGFFPQFNQTPSSAGYGFTASVTESGHMMLPTAILSFICGFITARLAQAIGTRQVIVIGSAITAVGVFMAAFQHTEKWDMYVAGGITGLGTGLCFACLANAVVDAVPPAQTGIATGMNSNIRTIGGSIGTAITTSLVTADVQKSGYPVEHGYVVGFCFLAGAAVLAALAGLLIPGRGRRTSEEYVEDFGLVAEGA